MVIDVHTHPVLFNIITESDEVLEYRKNQMGLYLSGRMDIDWDLYLMKDAKIDKTVILGQDYSADDGRILVSNDEIKKVVDYSPEHFIGFASVDPRNENAAEELTRAFDELGLTGLHLNVSRLHIFPDDQRLWPLMEICEKKNKPVIFHSGYSWKPNTPAKYARPILFEDIACAFPNLKMCLSHLGFPWWNEVIMMLMKYPNVYTDTATIYMDTSARYFDQLFNKDMNINWLQNSFADKVMFGSNSPRWRPVRALAGIKELPVREDVLEKIMGGNAMRFLGIKED